MKKLFATLLAATMVAGTAVSAFAFVGKNAANDPYTSADGNGPATTDSDYTLLNTHAYVKENNIYGAPDKNIVKSGAKLYYPILVSASELDVESKAATDYYFATKASEVDGLKATIKAVRGGKYIKGTSIVRQDIGVPAAAAAEYSYEWNANSALAGATIGTAPANSKDNVGTYKVKVVANSGNFDAELYKGDTKISSVATISKDTEIDFQVSGASFAKVTITDVVSAKEYVLGEVKAKETKPAGTTTKIYCVEVALADYFGTDETELEFDLDLRTRSAQYSSKDDKGPNMSFTLGKDSVTLEPEIAPFKKFRNGELTLSIDKNTRSVKLDEAKETKGAADTKDVEKIFLEGDNFDFEVKASGQGDLYLELNKDANKKVVLANQNAKMTFFNFPGKPEFDFTGVAKFTVEDPDVNYYFYEIVDNKPVKTNAKYNKEDECFELRTRTLGSYVISDKELEAADTTEKPSTDKPTDKPSEEKPVNPTTPDKNVPTGAIA